MGSVTVNPIAVWNAIDPVFRGAVTALTADWHRAHRAASVVYGHLHIPRTTWHDGIRFDEVSVGYPREWQRRGGAAPAPRVILGG